jgi:acyl carrier protein
MDKINLEEIKRFIYKKLEQEGTSKESVDPDQELVDSRIISSLLLVQIIVGIEDIIEQPVITDDIGIEDFTTINRIISKLEKLNV